MSIEDPTTYNAFQGLVYTDDWGTACPLQPFSTVNPFLFHDETEILYIQPTFLDEFDCIPKLRCFWKFTAPEYYSFKLVFTARFVSDNATLEVVTEDSRTQIIT